MFILQDKELCQRIINENPIKIKDFVVKYDYCQSTIKSLIKKCIISSFSNKNTKGSYTFIFENEMINYIKPTLNTYSFYWNVEKTIEYYLSNIKDSVNIREFEVLRRMLILKDSPEKIGKDFDLTKQRINMIFNYAFRKAKMSGRISNNYNDLKTKYDILETEYKFILEKKNALLKRYPKIKKESVKFKKHSEYQNIKLYDCDLSTRTLNCLKAAEFHTIGDLLKLNHNSVNKPTDFLKFRNFGKKSLTEIEEFLKGKGLHLGMNK